MLPPPPLQTLPSLPAKQVLLYWAKKGASVGTRADVAINYDGRTENKEPDAVTQCQKNEKDCFNFHCRPFPSESQGSPVKCPILHLQYLGTQSPLDLPFPRLPEEGVKIPTRRRKLAVWVLVPFQPWETKKRYALKKLFSFFALSLRQTFPIRSPLPPSASFLSLFRLLLSFILPCLCLCIYLIGQARRRIEKKGKTTKRVVVVFLSPLPFLFISSHSSKERGKIPQSPFRCFFFREGEYKKSGKERQTRSRHFPLLLGTKRPDIGRSFKLFQSFPCDPGLHTQLLSQLFIGESLATLSLSPSLSFVFERLVP